MKKGMLCFSIAIFVASFFALFIKVDLKGNTNVEILSFAPFDQQGIFDKIVQKGVELDELGLPETLFGATEGDVIVVEGITWFAEPEYNPDEVGSYMFSAYLPMGYEFDGILRAYITVGSESELMPLGLCNTETTSTPITLSTGSDLYSFSYNFNNGYIDKILNLQNSSAIVELADNIDLVNFKYSNGGIGFQPIGTYTKPFDGYFDGKGHFIENLLINDINGSNQGLFGFISNARVENLAVINADISGGDNVGIIAGNAEESIITNCFATGNIFSNSYTGGISGFINNSSILDSYSQCYLSSKGVCIGGIVGFAENSSNISSSYSIGNVTGMSNAGGIAGEVSASNISNCAALNEFVFSNTQSGRIAGERDYNSFFNNNAAFNLMKSQDNVFFIGDGGNDINGLTVSALELQNNMNNVFSEKFIDPQWVYFTGCLPVLGAINQSIQPHAIPDYILNAKGNFGGFGTEDFPFLIQSEDDLLLLSEFINNGVYPFYEAETYFKLETNLDLNGHDYQPIGSSSYPFKGKFDGNGNVIENLTMINPEISYQGLFGYAENAVVKNLGIKSFNIEGYDYQGALAGFVRSCQIFNCYSVGSILGKNYIGGIIGKSSGSSISDCYSASNITGNVCVGGIIGQTDSGSVTSCYASGDVYANGYAGGLIGEQVAGGTVALCAAFNGTVSSQTFSGRILGRVGENPALNDNIAYKYIKNNSGGIFADGNLSDLNGLSLLSEDITQDRNNILSQRFGINSWLISPGMLPILKLFATDMQPESMPIHINQSVIALSGTGEEDSPYLINNEQDMAVFATLINDGVSPYSDTGKCFKLLNDINMEKYSSGSGFNPIGNEENKFSGIFDGNGKSVLNISINRINEDYQGFFGYTDTAEINNLSLTNCKISGKNFVGGLVGYGYYTKINNCYVDGFVGGINYVGGLAGYVFTLSNVNGCLSKANVEGELYIGGIAGYTIYNCSLTNSYTTGKVNGNSYIGGIVGNLINTSSISNCYSASEITGIEKTGGIAGEINNNSSIKNCAGLNVFIGGVSDNGRIAGRKNTGSLSNNIGFVGVINGSGNFFSGNDDVDIDGQAITAESIIDGSQLFSNLFPQPEWKWVSNGLPMLSGIKDSYQSAQMPSHIKGLRGNGDSINPYIIDCEDDFVLMAGLINYNIIPYSNSSTHYIVTNTIDLENIKWTPVGTEENPFKGKFNGNGNVILNLYVNKQQLNNQGLFGVISGAYIENLGVKNCYVAGNLNTGAIAGITSGSIITNCYTTGWVAGSINTGGITGLADNGSEIKHCYSAAQIAGGDYTGGVSGNINLAKIYESYSVGLVKGDNYVGGLSGSIAESSIINCTALNQSVIGTNNTGRITGGITGNGGLACYAYMNMTGDSRYEQFYSLDTVNVGVNKKHGESITNDQLTDSLFWQGIFGSQNWIISDKKLPIVKTSQGIVLDGQESAIPFHLADYSTAFEPVLSPLKIESCEVNNSVTVKLSGINVNDFKDTSWSIISPDYGVTLTYKSKEEAVLNIEPDFVGEVKVRIDTTGVAAVTKVLSVYVHIPYSEIPVRTLLFGFKAIDFERFMSMTDEEINSKFPNTSEYYFKDINGNFRNKDGVLAPKEELPPVITFLN